MTRVYKVSTCVHRSKYPFVNTYRLGPLMFTVAFTFLPIDI